MNTDAELDASLGEVLAQHDAARCQTCGHQIGWGDVAWNTGSTEAGTPWSFVEIICAACQSGIAHVRSWYDIEDREDVVHVLEKDNWEIGRGEP